MARLDELRSALNEIDSQLLTLLGRRRELALQIGREKRALDRPTRDWARERVVLDRARENAAALGVPPDLAEEVMRAQIRASLRAQEQERVSSVGTGTGQRALIIGGAGKMGAWFARFLDNQGYRVEGADPAARLEGLAWRDDWKDGPIDHDVVVVATPLRTTARILAELVEARPTGVIFDIGSLKSPLTESLGALREAGMSVTSLHPMFGPDTDLLSGRHVIVADVGVPAANDIARALFAPTMAELVDMQLEEHDQLISYVLGMSHALNIAFFTALADSGAAAPRLAELSSTTFDAQLSIAGRVSHENPNLYFEIQAENAFGLSALDGLLAALQTVRDHVANRNEEAFVHLMERGRAYLEGRRVTPKP
jgi:chorismate mutase / prephenate dehydrogenase